MKVSKKIFKDKFLKPKFVVFGVLVVVSILFVFFRLKNAGTKVSYQTSQVEKGTIISSVSASGQILTANTFPISTSASGVVKKVYVTDGQTVSKGQRIAEIELDSEGAKNHASSYSNYLSAQVSLNSANNSFRSTQASAENILDQLKGHDTDETLAQKDQRTKAEVARDNAYDGIKSAQAKLNSAALDYQASSPVIIAPNSGIVDNITVVAGLTLPTSTTTQVAVIHSKGTPLASFNLSEVDISKIKQGQKATIKLDSIADKTFTGKIVSVNKMGSVTSGVTNYPVIISFDTEVPEALSNMSASANIILETKDNVLLVPSSSIQVQSGQSVVKVLKNGKEESVNVETGLSSDTQIEIISGLTEGDEVITSTTGATNQSGSSGASVFGTRGFGSARIIEGR
jgi:RND family efflux transporter MFP subunit